LVTAAKDALDQFELPKEAVDRLSSLMSVGAMIIVTDLGLGRRRRSIPITSSKRRSDAVE
jgi:hypothetical protein